MKKDPVIILKNITKKYYLEKPQTLKRLLKNLFHPFEKFTVIKNFSLTINKGEFILLTGPNGSGKTTLLKLIAGIIKPDSGEIKTYGRIVPLIELGAGFNFELTGRENILINATILGLSKKEIKEKMNAIISFSEIGRFIDIPLKRYSTGMISRLAFSIAAFSNPDILLLDEIFAVGDINFRQKISTVLSQFKKQKKTIILTTNFPLGLKIFDREVLLDINSSKININKKTFPINFFKRSTDRLCV
jgi:ABC-type polysaccharide/polyol phosphate transport system ATPase subunit